MHIANLVAGVEYLLAGGLGMNAPIIAWMRNQQGRVQSHVAIHLLAVTTKSVTLYCCYTRVAAGSGCPGCVRPEHELKFLQRANSSNFLHSYMDGNGSMHYSSAVNPIQSKNIDIGLSVEY